MNFAWITDRHVCGAREMGGVLCKSNPRKARQKHSILLCEEENSTSSAWVLIMARAIVSPAF